MARIILDPGEEFEHYHTDESLTRLVSGRVTLTCEGQSRELCRNEAVCVPAGAAHTIVNIGSTRARVDCSHGGGGGSGGGTGR